MGNNESLRILKQLVPSEAYACSIDKGILGKHSAIDSFCQLKRWGLPFSPFDYQSEMIDGLCRRAERGPVLGLISLPTGSGKTSTCGRIVLSALSRQYESTNALWIAPQKELLYQAFGAIRNAWSAGFGPDLLDLQIVQRSSDLHSSTRPVCWFATPMMARKVAATLESDLSALVFDEAHHLSRNVFGRTWFTFKSSTVRPRFAIGLTATPSRTDEPEVYYLKEAFQKKLFLPKTLGSDPIRSLIESRVLSSPIFHRIEGVSKYARSRGAMDQRSLHTFVSDPERWSAVIECIQNQASGQLIVYALNRDHGRLLTRHLKYLGESVEYLDGKCSIALRTSILERFQKRETRVLVNVALLLEGVDCPSADGVVLTYPVGSDIKLQQMIGRVLRGPRVGGADLCHVWSLDGSQEWLENILHNREFHRHGWDIEYV